ncbi:MAG: hypothetical protein Q8P23_03270 [bacterium]|nr:hypothetical protein [bacterium]
MKRLAVLVLLAGLALVGCATVNSIVSPTAESLDNDFAGILGVRPGQVTVSDIETKNNKTYFVAKTVNGTYNCAVDSGALVALVYSTMTRTCTKVENESSASTGNP